MRDKTLYEVAVDCERCSIGPHRVYVTVVASDMHEALDLATEHSNASRLWDEELQRAIADGESVRPDHDRYIEEIEYVGDLE